jgi:hypothetical protein
MVKQSIYKIRLRNNFSIICCNVSRTNNWKFKSAIIYIQKTIIAKSQKLTKKGYTTSLPVNCGINPLWEMARFGISNQSAVIGRCYSATIKIEWRCKVGIEVPDSSVEISFLFVQEHHFRAQLTPPPVVSRCKAPPLKHHSFDQKTTKAGF